MNEQTTSVTAFCAVTTALSDVYGDRNIGQAELDELVVRIGELASFWRKLEPTPDGRGKARGTVD